MDPSRYEAHVIAAAALRRQKEYGGALVHLRIAIALAPDDEKPRVSHAIAELKVASLSPDSRRRLDGFMLILDDAHAAQSSADREKFLREFLEKSEGFLATYPAISDLWVIRAGIAIDLNEPVIGWRAGRKLIELGEDHSENPAIRKLLARLERNGWLSENPADIIAALVSAFNARIQAIGVQQFHGTDFLKNRIDTTNSMSDLTGDCKTGFETTESLLTIQKGAGFTDPDYFGSNVRKQPLTILVDDAHFNAIVSQMDPSEDRGYAWAFGVAPVRTHDGTAHTDFRGRDGAGGTTNDRTEDGPWPVNFIYAILFSNSKPDMQFLADTLMKIHLVCMDRGQ